MKPVEGYEVYHWPEFIAFAKRLGVPWELPTIDLNIFIPVDGFVKITQEFDADEFSIESKKRRIKEDRLKEQP